MLIVKQQIVATDKEGYLSQLSAWNETVAHAIAEQDSLMLTEDHWRVINFLRDFYQQYQITPAIRVLVKELAKQLPAEKGNSLYLNSLFPLGLAKQASKIAGLPKPTRCT